MGNFRIYFTLLLTILFTSVSIQAQENANRKNIEKLYGILQTKGLGPNEVTALTPGINWKEINTSKDEDRYTISFPAVMTNRWHSLEFRDLDFKEVTENEILVTGTVSARQHSECEFITSEFRHSWSLQDGKIVQFLE